MKTPILFLILSILAGCTGSHVPPASDAGTPPGDGGTCTLEPSESCAAWTARATDLGCAGAGGMTWPCPWVAPIELPCLDAINAAETCTDLGLVPNACPVCR